MQGAVLESVVRHVERNPNEVFTREFLEEAITKRLPSPVNLVRIRKLVKPEDDCRVQLPKINHLGRDGDIVETIVYEFTGIAALVEILLVKSSKIELHLIVPGGTVTILVSKKTPNRSTGALGFFFLDR